MLAFVKLRITCYISMYIMCAVFVQRFELRGRRFTNFHHCYYFYYYYKPVDKIASSSVPSPPGHFRVTSDWPIRTPSVTNIQTALFRASCLSDVQVSRFGLAVRR